MFTFCVSFFAKYAEAESPASRTRLTTSASLHLPGRFLIINTLVFSQRRLLGWSPSSWSQSSRSADSLKWSPRSSGVSDPAAKALVFGQNLLAGSLEAFGPELLSGSSPSHRLIYNLHHHPHPSYLPTGDLGPDAAGDVLLRHISFTLNASSRKCCFHICKCNMMQYASFLDLNAHATVQLVSFNHTKSPRNIYVTHVLVPLEWIVFFRRQEPPASAFPALGASMVRLRLQVANKRDHGGSLFLHFLLSIS